MIKTGSTSLWERQFSDIAKMRIGFVSNHTSRLNDGTLTLSALISSGNVTVVRLFSPEHGSAGILDDSVVDSIDPVTGIPIVSLYGERRKPSLDLLADLDALVFEIQDIGARFYTYFATLCLCINAASEAEIPIYVLDRPNPINGIGCDGPDADQSLLSFVAPHTVPVRHGLTLGEMALLYQAETHKKPNVTVIPADGWTRGLWFDQTGLSWVNPSPNMRSLSAAALYPGVCLLEQTNVSVGRGTDAPFERVGAPFINGHEWLRAIEREALPGVTIFSRPFTPYTGKYAGVECGGLRLVLSQREALSSVRLGIALITSLRDLYGGQFELDGVQTLLVNDESYKWIASGASTHEIYGLWRSSLNEWEKRRAPYLLYSS